MSTPDRDRLLEGDVARGFLAAVLSRPEVRVLLNDQHFAVDGTLLQAWTSMMKSFRPKDGPREPSEPGRNSGRDSAASGARTRPHASTILRRGSSEGRSKKIRLRFVGHALMDSRQRLVVGGRVSLATGAAERDEAAGIVAAVPGRHWITAGRDKNFDARFRGRPAGAERHAARRAEHHRPPLSDQRPYGTASRLRAEPAGPQADLGAVRLDQGGGASAARRLPRQGAGWPGFTLAAAAYNPIRLLKLLGGAAA